MYVFLLDDVPYRNYRSHLRADDGTIWTYLVLPIKRPTPPTPMAKDDHMLTVEGVSVQSPAGQALITARVNRFCEDMQDEVRRGRIARGVDPITGR